VRAEYADGFGLARASNTTPVVVLRFEADNQAALTRIQNEFKAALAAVWPGVATNF
jgi:phosphomannomutase/phosphoglucomutase